MVRPPRLPGGDWSLTMCVQGQRFVKVVEGLRRVPDAPPLPQCRPTSTPPVAAIAAPTVPLSVPGTAGR